MALRNTLTSTNRNSDKTAPPATDEKTLVILLMKASILLYEILTVPNRFGELKFAMGVSPFSMHFISDTYISSDSAESFLKHLQKWPIAASGGQYSY